MLKAACGVWLLFNFVSLAMISDMIAADTDSQSKSPSLRSVSHSRRNLAIMTFTWTLPSAMSLSQT